MVENLLKDYNKRLEKEAFFKALICGAIIGFAALFVAATIFWLTEFKHVWLGAVVFVAVTGAGTPLFYFKKFRPSARTVAKRIDKLGLEERMLTMTQFANDNSYIAVRQREDAKRALATVNPKLLQIVISVPLIIGLAVSALTGAGMVTVSALSSAGLLNSGKEVIEEVITPPLEEFEVSYDVKGEGMIEGEIFQIVLEGRNAKGVMAVADDEWVFMGWSDGVEDPYREDINIQEDLHVIAIFMLGMDGFPGDGEGEEGEDPNAPDGEEGNKPGKEDGGKRPTAEWQANNQVIDGKTYYGGPTYDNAYEQAMEELQQNEEIPDELKAIIESYFQTIEQ
ncbi:MAG: hypothetical protein IJX88_04270 [Clostridia bacterium]|nr:hypothetical protein [Clostridia bacterium]